MVMSTSCALDVALVIRISSVVARIALLGRVSRCPGNGFLGRLAREETDECTERSVGPLLTLVAFVCRSRLHSPCGLGLVAFPEENRGAIQVDKHGNR